MARRLATDQKTEAEEAAWHATPEGREQTKKEFERALRAGAVVRSSGAGIPRTDPQLLQQLMEQAKAKATRAISIRLPIADIERAQAIATKRGVGYQTILKQAIRAGLK